MGSIKYSNNKVFVKTICVLFAFSMLICNKGIVCAETIQYIIPGDKNTYDYNDLLQSYELNSATYELNNITYRIEALKGVTASESYKNLNNQYLAVAQKIEELSRAKKQLIAYRDSLLSEQNSADQITEDTNNKYNISQAVPDDREVSDLLKEVDTQIAAIDGELDQYQNNIITTGESAAEAKLQENIASFYNTYQNLITIQGENKIKNDFLKQCLNLILIREQTKY